LQQAVWNLLSNAIKFTPRGGRVDVTVAHRDGQVELAVADTGEGIEASVLPFVFDRFRQGDSGTTRTHMGLGLGLAIVRHIVELHGGSVKVASAGKGRGATFTICIPAQTAEWAAIVSYREPAQLNDAALEGLRALVVDDDRDARELLGELLRSRGVEVTTASSTDEGLRAIDRDVPDVIVSDLAMPGRDGFEFIRVVRQRPENRGGRVPAIALTAYARAEDSARSLSSGFQMHLSKPVDINTLFNAVAALSGRSNGTLTQ
jgi:CheY-like chemotaxis protein